MGFDFKVTLLGTGHPSPRLDRFSPSTLIEAADPKMLFDCGRGTTQRIYQFSKQTQDYDKLFLTHLHSDHTTGIPDLWITGNIMGRYDKPLRVWGPPGTSSMMTNLEKAFESDLRVRRMGEQRFGLDRQRGIKFVAADVDERFVYEKDGLTVEPFRVNHYMNISDEVSFGFRIRYEGRTVVVSGDTCYCENLLKYSMGTDLLIHEVAAAPIGAVLPNDIRYYLSIHTSPEKCCKLFSAVKPKLAVFYHVLQYMGVSQEEILGRMRKDYDVTVVFGEDLMRITVEDTVEVQANRQV
jgi:ribonuclease Z